MGIPVGKVRPGGFRACGRPRDRVSPVDVGRQPGRLRPFEHLLQVGPDAIGAETSAPDRNAYLLRVGVDF